MNCSCQAVTENVLGESIMGTKKRMPAESSMAVRGHFHYPCFVLHPHRMVKGNPPVPLILVCFQQPPL